MFVPFMSFPFFLIFRSLVIFFYKVSCQHKSKDSLALSYLTYLIKYFVYLHTDFLGLTGFVKCKYLKNIFKSFLRIIRHFDKRIMDVYSS